MLTEGKVRAIATQVAAALIRKGNYGAVSEDAINGAVEKVIRTMLESGDLKGEPGYTPVKGIDYWTPAEQADMVADVLAALPASEEVAL